MGTKNGWELDIFLYVAKESNYTGALFRQKFDTNIDKNLS
jgi:hypothetical protein